MKGPVRELIPLGEQKVLFRLPDGLHAKKIHLLAADKTPQVRRDGSVLTITVPTILDHEVVAIDV
jgi:hypothetical protein